MEDRIWKYWILPLCKLFTRGLNFCSVYNARHTRPNGVTERRNRDLMDMVRNAMRKCNLLESLYYEALK